jgi:GTPase SAR1 family protein
MFEPTGAGPDVMRLPPVVGRIENQTDEERAPIVVLVVGMAGSGKTTLMAQLQQSTVVEEYEDGDEGQGDEEGEGNNNSANSDPSKMPAYVINLGPATLDVPYSPSIDIRDTIDYKVRNKTMILLFASVRKFFLFVFKIKDLSRYLYLFSLTPAF